VNLPVDEVFHAVVDVDRWDSWLVRIPSRWTSQGPLAIGSTAVVPLENFWGTPAGIVAALAGLSRTYPYGRAYGEMEVIEYSRNRALMLVSRNSPIRLQVSGLQLVTLHAKRLHTAAFLRGSAAQLRDRGVTVHSVE
jgi:hypothetical protein